jgi:hypothetical protein
MLTRKRTTRKHEQAVLAAVAGSILSVAGAAGEDRLEPLPSRLSATGLLVAGSTSDVSADVLSFSPQYPLWSDGATKRRWIYLPPGTYVDATDPDAWRFPPGTRLWKEFSQGRRVETRMIELTADGSWRFATYVWNDEGTDAVLAPEAGIASLPVPAAPAGRYAIPSETDCRACHEGAPVPVLGFSALQLSPKRDPLAVHGEAPADGDQDLATLTASGRLRHLPAVLLEKPPQIEARSATERAALGYLHGNCGHCHAAPSDSDAAVPVPVQLSHSAAEPSSTANVLASLVGARSRFQPHRTAAPMPVLAPGNADASILVARLRSRDPRVQMPPLGTVVPDTAALALIARWIDAELGERHAALTKEQGALPTKEQPALTKEEESRR